VPLKHCLFVQKAQYALTSLHPTAACCAKVSSTQEVLNTIEPTEAPRAIAADSLAIPVNDALPKYRVVAFVDLDRCAWEGTKHSRVLSSMRKEVHFLTLENVAGIPVAERVKAVADDNVEVSLCSSQRNIHAQGKVELTKCTGMSSISCIHRTAPRSPAVRTSCS
jgi:hypothetical protein